MAQKDISPSLEEVSRTENFTAWKSVEPDEEEMYHIQFGKATVHFFVEEWEEFVDFVSEFVDIPLGTTGTWAETDSYLASCDEEEKENIYTLEMPGLMLFFFEEDWNELLELFRDLK